MLFNTITYGYFFGIVFLTSWCLSRWHRLRLGFLLVSSYVFYAGWTFVGWEEIVAAEGLDRVVAILQSIKYVPLLFVATSVDWLLGVALGAQDNPRRRKLFLVATVLINVGILVFFKYWNWGADTFIWLADKLFGVQLPDIHFRVELPIGISFFCFMSLSYVVDVYRREIPPCRSYLQYLTYISFFPHLVAGPIIRGRDLLPHLTRPTRLTAETGGEGLFLIAQGLVKKVIIGDFLALNLVDRVFEAPTSYSSVEVIFAMYGYAVQVYCDFSGYSDIATGSALLLGYRFKINFDAPFKSLNIVEFWRRWHVSLSTWLRDYVYFSLGGGRRGPVRKYFNVFLTMVVAGVWHGAAWTYFIFGCIQGTALAVTHWWQEPAKAWSAMRPGAWFRGRLDATLAYAAEGLFKKYAFASLLLLPAAYPCALVRNYSATWRARRTAAGRGVWFPSRVVSVAATFTFVALTFTMFRAASLDKALAMYERLGTFTTYTPNLHAPVLAIIFGALVLQWTPRRAYDFVRSTFIRAPAVAQAVVLVGIAYALRWAAAQEAVPFVYFSF